MTRPEAADAALRSLLHAFSPLGRPAHDKEGGLKMSAVINRLRHIYRRCSDDADPHFRWLGAALNDFLTHRSRSLEEALGLQFPRGGIPWWREEATRERDAALRALVARFWPGQTATAQARHVRTLSRRYAASTWRHDAKREAMPISYVGTPHEWLWRAFASGAPMPLCERQLRHILGADGKAAARFLPKLGEEGRPA